MAGSERGPFALLKPDGVGDNAALPLVVLLGWAAADRDKAVFKRNWALALLRYLEDQGLWPHRPLVLFAFSNGGLYVVEQLLLIAESDPRYARLPDTIAALVVDSAPVTAGPSAVQNVIAASAPPGWRRWALTRYIQASMRLRGPDGGMAAYWANLRRMGWGRPQLFVYSRDDPIADAIEIDKLVAEKRALGQDVRARCWKKSAHCAHLKHHTGEYTHLLFGLLEEVQGHSRGGGSNIGSSSGGSSHSGSGGGTAGALPADVLRSRL
ncbi:transmembrane 53-A-like [Chlorella sorokiniana]|uniref:Transmembrane 53-A-like n=1 Tax=Chlorella sorokiniana TaxID=3076 RepID=A0A2P6TYX9_CHLSO|nr:transmembrane 53-A-like [Chlorella sorokiniana]|eukprot:PRW59268.1 transmembrane 53-A-like [Chlorella sorokiniana]